MENNNMSNEEKLRKLMEEMKKLGNIDLSEDVPKAAAQSCDEKAEDIIDIVSKIGMNKFKEVEQLVKKMKDGADSISAPVFTQKQETEPEKEPEKKKSPTKDDMVGLLYKEYGGISEDTGIDKLLTELAVCSTDAEKFAIISKLKKAAGDEAEKAFRAGFDAAKELLK